MLGIGCAKSPLSMQCASRYRFAHGRVPLRPWQFAPISNRPRFNRESQAKWQHSIRASKRLPIARVLRKIDGHHDARPVRCCLSVTSRPIRGRLANGLIELCKWRTSDMSVWSKSIFFVLAFGAVNAATGRTYSKDYYINTETGKDDNDGSLDHPWKNSWRIGVTDLRPGDAIYFARGQKWTGGFAVDSSGTIESPILVSAYGTGERPILTNPDNKKNHGNCLRIRGDHVTVENLHFDAAADANGKRVDVFEVGAIYIAKGADHAVIRDCTFSDCPKGVNLFGEHATITRNQFLNKGRPLQEPYWGPIAICIQSGHHRISYNTFKGHMAPSKEYNWDGGAIEVDVHTKSADGVWIHHNTSIGNCGFIENEFWAMGGRNRDWIIAYNVIDDYQWFIDVGPSGDSIIAHNTISIREADPKCPLHFFMDGSFRRNSGLYCNNIFISWGGSYLDAVPASLRKHNLFFSMDRRTEHPGGMELGEGEQVVDPLFVDSPHQDFHLLPNSPAIDAGLNVGLTNEVFRLDRDGTPVPSGGSRDVGAYEHRAGIGATAQ